MDSVGNAKALLELKMLRNTQGRKSCYCYINGTAALMVQGKTRKM